MMPGRAQAPARKIDPYRRALYGKVAVARKQLRLDEEAYRDLLEARYRKRSLKRLSNAQLVDLIEHFKSLGFKPAPPKSRARRASARVPAMSAKIRALWRALWDLGVVREPGDKALAAFIRRQTGLDSPSWMDGEGAYRAIEALKAMAEREGGVDWRAHKNPRVCVVYAQWWRLGQLGALRIPAREALNAWLHGQVSRCRTDVELLDDAQLDDAQARLGRWLRRALPRIS